MKRIIYRLQAELFWLQQEPYINHMTYLNTEYRYRWLKRNYYVKYNYAERVDILMNYIRLTKK